MIERFQVVTGFAKFGVSADALQSLGMKYEIFRQGFWIVSDQSLVPMDTFFKSNMPSKRSSEVHLVAL
jgi:hypothetical protein